MALFVHILWNAHPLKDLGLDIINGISLLNLQPNSLFLPSDDGLLERKFGYSFPQRTRAGIGLAFDFSMSWEAAFCVSCLTESPERVESGNEISEDAMALAFYGHTPHGASRIGVHLRDVHLIDVPLIDAPLISVYSIGVPLVGVPLMACSPWRVSYGHAYHRRTSH
jgi:hypothetical protein